MVALSLLTSQNGSRQANVLFSRPQKSIKIERIFVILFQKHKVLQVLQSVNLYRSSGCSRNFCVEHVKYYYFLTNYFLNFVFCRVKTCITSITNIYPDFYWVFWLIPVIQVILVIRISLLSKKHCSVKTFHATTTNDCGCGSY
jgi:hypothetical protein